MSYELGAMSFGLWALGYEPSLATSSTVPDRP